MGIFEELKSVASTLRKADKIEEYQKILDVQEKLLELQKRISDLENENRELISQKDIRDSLIYRPEVYFLKKADGQEDGPFCHRCWDVDNKLVRLEDTSSRRPFCSQCRNAFSMGQLR